MSQSQRKAREFREASLEVQLSCNAALNAMADASEAEAEGRITDAANLIGRASAFVTDAFDAIANAHAALRGRRDSRAKKPTDANPVPGFTSTARGEKVYRTIPADAKRTPQESEEERA